MKLLALIAVLLCFSCGHVSTPTKPPNFSESVRTNLPSNFKEVHSDNWSFGVPKDFAYVKEHGLIKKALVSPDNNMQILFTSNNMRGGSFTIEQLANITAKQFESIGVTVLSVEYYRTINSKPIHKVVVKMNDYEYMAMFLAIDSRNKDAELGCMVTLQNDVVNFDQCYEIAQTLKEVQQ